MLASTYVALYLLIISMFLFKDLQKWKLLSPEGNISHLISYFFQDVNLEKKRKCQISLMLSLHFSWELSQRRQGLLSLFQSVCYPHCWFFTLQDRKMQLKRIVLMLSHKNCRFEKETRRIYECWKWCFLFPEKNLSLGTGEMSQIHADLSISGEWKQRRRERDERHQRSSPLISTADICTSTRRGNLSLQQHSSWSRRRGRRPKKNDTY